MQEQPPGWYWDLNQAAWVPCEPREQLDEDEPVEAEQEQER
ncbi:MAG TPA: hypothetical protein VKB37_02790 [Jatrophihabitantaceae bacterium]|jgi:hypothetical protein|nr:hypothetical protein [Jatrophihabitantaceae bacterium]